MIGSNGIESSNFIYKETLRVHLIKVPGFDDVAKADSEALEDLASYLSATYDKNVRMSGIIYLQSITNRIMSYSARYNLDMFQKLCGSDCMPNIILATTWWDSVYPSVGAANEQELIQTQGFLGFMHSHGSVVMRHSRGRESAMAILELALRKRRRLTLQIQREINIEGLNLYETEAGRELTKFLLEKKEWLEYKLEEVGEDIEKALKLQRTDLLEELKQKRSHLQDKLDRLLSDKALTAGSTSP